ncbi:MAG: sigma factor-like helix-turn-helix DNA-binding protein [Bradyrhizobium sp.]|uniref:sigma factor-like helix-turn-helix DNA-binding protein n=1 Tax=Bradyrhizobium sp. TaxID=376 RepID=UPI003D102CAB
MTRPFTIRTHPVDADLDGLSQPEVARRTGLSNQRVDQLERAAIRKLWRMQVNAELCHNARIPWWGARHPGAITQEDEAA